MNIAGLTLPDIAGLLVGTFLTLCVFSYLLGDNALFRLATHIFIGVASAYVAVTAWFNVIWPKLILPFLNWETGSISILNYLIPLLLSILLLFKLVPRLSTLGSPVMAYLVGIGAATAIGGGVMGTLFPQVAATINLFDGDSAGGDIFWLLIIESSFILVGTLSALIYFHFGARSPHGGPPQRAIWIDGISNIGKYFIAVTFGALFAGVLTAALTALVERWNFILSFILSFFSWLI